MCTYIHIYVIINAKKLIESSKATFSFSLTLSLHLIHLSISLGYIFIFFMLLRLILQLYTIVAHKGIFCCIGNIRFFPSLRWARFKGVLGPGICGAPWSNNITYNHENRGESGRKSLRVLFMVRDLDISLAIKLFAISRTECKRRNYTVHASVFPTDLCVFYWQWFICIWHVSGYLVLALASRFLHF